MKKFKSKSDPKKRVNVSVEEIENGYIICKNSSWDEDGEYKYEEKKYFTKENPFEEVEEGDSESESAEKMPVWALFK